MKRVPDGVAKSSPEGASLRVSEVARNGPGWTGEAFRLGFGCAAMMGRVGRKDSLAALGAAYDAGIRFFDVARSYGYGEAEALLGEFLRGRRSEALISTKFGIVPAAKGPLSPARSLKPLVRSLLRVAPGARRMLQQRLASQSSAGHFSVADLHASLEISLRALRTDYVDILFLHEPPSSVLQQDELFTALGRLVAAGKVRWVGVAATPQGIEATLAARPLGVRYLQFACNLSNLGVAQRVVARADGDLISMANHPFGGPAGVAAGKALLGSLASAPTTPLSLQEKLRSADDALLADVVLNLVTKAIGVQIVLASMLTLEHLGANLAALRQSRFDAEELRWLREIVASGQVPAPAGARQA